MSHAGHGSVMKALWYGRPMVLVPWGRDQPGVAFRAAALGVAEVVPREDATAEAFSAAVDRALGDEAMRREAARHGERLRATRSVRNGGRARRDAALVPATPSSEPGDPAAPDAESGPKAASVRGLSPGSTERAIRISVSPFGWTSHTRASGFCQRTTRTDVSEP